MTEVKLEYPVNIGGTTISAITLRRPKAKDMIALGDHLPALAALDTGEGDAQVASNAAAAAMSRKVFEAMVAIVSTLGSVDVDVAMELDYADLVNISTEAFGFMGEASEDGAEKTGAAQSPKPRSSSTPR